MPHCRISQLTSEEQLLRSRQETLLSLRVRHWVEAPHAHDLPDCVTTTVVGVRVGAQNAAQVGFQPQFISSLPLLAPFIDAIALDGSGYGDMDAHV